MMKLTSKQLARRKWNSFERYPSQGIDVYIKCHNVKLKVDRFAMVENFNTVTFNAREIFRIEPKDKNKYEFYWLAADSANKKD